MNYSEIEKIFDTSSSLWAEAHRLELLGLRLQMLSLMKERGEEGQPYTFHITDEAAADNPVTAAGFSEDFRLFPKSVTIDIKGNAVTVGGTDAYGQQQDGVDIEELMNGDCESVYKAIIASLGLEGWGND